MARIVSTSLFLFLLCFTSVLRAQDDFVIRSKPFEEIPELTIDELVDVKTLRASGYSISPAPGQVLAIRSKATDVEIVGFVEILSSRIRSDGKVEIKAKVLRLSRYYLVRPGDSLVQLDLTTDEPIYRGHTELFVRSWSGPDISSRYRPLFTQGFSIGETAQTLQRDEIFVGVYGHLSYGLTERLTAGSFLTGFLLDSPNGNLKYKVWDENSDTVSMALSVTKIKESSSTALNLTIYWDAITSDKMVSHALATFAVATLSQDFRDTAAIKGAGSSSFQTGYEMVLDSWDRVLFGPSYNFELKSLGGYLAYKRIWNHFHLSGSLSTVDVRELKLDPKTGYVALVEAYWRF
ncbi:MAG TPA: hypothetical protein PL182_12435 [Pseudobdellovibrionaceae bacterium]|nr:hypothetical protein [Pseudobdellovibrionaceae bacterium]